MEEPRQTEWTGNEAQDPNRFKDDVQRFNARNHPNTREIDFKDWMIVSPNSMVDQFAVGATIEDTVCPANPTGPTNISCWGETPPHSAEMIAAATPAEDTYVLQERADNLTPEMTELEDAHRPRIVALFAGEPQAPELFAPALGGMQPEAAGTEDVHTMEYEPSGEETPVEIPIAVSAGVIGYTRNPNATHPSNTDPQPVEPPPGGGGTDPEPEVPPIDLTSIAPETAIAGSGTFALTVTGTGFQDGDVILFKEVPVATTFVSDTQLQADAVPVSAVPETVDVEVQRGAELSDVLTFDFVAAGREGEERERRSPQRKPSKKQKSKGGGKGKGAKTSKKSGRK